MNKFEIDNVTLTEEDIDDIMVDALEGGCTSLWCCRVVTKGKYLGNWTSDQISRGGELVFFNIEDSKKYVLDRNKFLKGFELWLQNGGDWYGAVSDGKVDPGKIDACQSDVIIQYALFGEVVYG